MSTTIRTQEKGTDSDTDEPEQFDFVRADECHVNVRNCAKDTVYTVTLATDGSVALSCTYPDYKYRHADTTGSLCKHGRAVEVNLADIRPAGSDPPE